MNLNLENKKQIATFLLAIGLGAVAAIGTGQYVSNAIKTQTNTLAKDYEKQTVLLKQSLEQQLAKRDREFDKKLKAMAQQYSQQMQQARNSESAVVSGRPMQIVDSTIFSTITPPGKRALTILIDALSAVGGLVNPGDYVDVLGHLEIPDDLDPEADPQKVTSVLFQNIQVLAVGANFKPVGNALIYQNQQKERALNVTLAVSPEEVGLLTFAQSHGKLQLVLRAPAEKETEVLEVAAWETLSDYVLDRQGTELDIQPKAIMNAPTAGLQPTEEIKPFVQIFRRGEEL